ncbi:hypothetical protein UFOVP451_7 [uncultured Caudovirales phage]|uniref:Uncharacterized protein n=1 Tax=uncultured Caudovirales phage TaxID=2100421 RepID=A0A6J5MBD7_9CAUD|nr:hypothetical protein UFOVP451_7 [uncultured Caudovirales phage]
MEWLAEIGKEYGLFVALVVYVLWENQKREERYIQIIDSLSEEIKGDLAIIKNKIGGE